MEESKSGGCLYRLFEMIFGVICIVLFLSRIDGCSDRHGTDTKTDDSKEQTAIQFFTEYSESFLEIVPAPKVKDVTLEASDEYGRSIFFITYDMDEYAGYDIDDFYCYVYIIFDTDGGGWSYDYEDSYQLVSDLSEKESTFENLKKKVRFGMPFAESESVPAIADIDYPKGTTPFSTESREIDISNFEIVSIDDKLLKDADQAYIKCKVKYDYNEKVNVYLGWDSVVADCYNKDGSVIGQEFLYPGSDPHVEDEWRIPADTRKIVFRLDENHE